MTPDDPPRYEYRAWAEAFPDLPALRDDEPWGEETYILALGLASLDVKIRGGALEIKEMLADRGGLQLWSPAATLAFPIPALTLERVLMTRLMIGQPLSHEHYGEAELMGDVVNARANVESVSLRKRRHLFEADGCRAEVAQVAIGPHTVMTACVEHETPEQVAAAASRLGIDRYPNHAYPMALIALLPRLRAVDAADATAASGSAAAPSPDPRR